MSDQKEFPVCGACGSTHVVVDAFAEWNAETQEWVLHSTYGDGEGVCDACGADGPLVWRPLPENKAAVAADALRDTVRPFVGRAYDALSHDTKALIVEAWGRCLVTDTVPPSVVKKGVIVFPEQCDFREVTRTQSVA